MTDIQAINEFNALDGKTITAAKLRAFHKKAARLAKGHPAADPIHQVSKKLGQAVRSIQGADKLKITISQPVDTLTGLEGLEYIKDDSGLDAQGLGGVNEVYQIITDRIIKLIKENKGQHVEKWKKSPLFRLPAVNWSTKKAYSGINFLLLAGDMGIIQGMRDQDSPYFMTYKQVERHKGQVKKGAEAYPVIYYTLVQRDQEGNLLTKEEAQAVKKAGEELTEYPAIRYYNVFNSEDIEGIDFQMPEEKTVLDSFNNIEVAEKIYRLMPKRPPVANKGSKAYYTPSKDSITMPPQKKFYKEAYYYSTLFHELIHATGHPSRVGRDLSGQAPNPKYAKEELIAELGASFLNSHAGILYYNINRAADYIKGWSARLTEHMKKDNKFIFQAAAQAHKAADYILAGRDYIEDQLKVLENPEAKAPEAKTEEKTPGLEALPVKISKDDIPYQVAFNAHRMMSFSPEKRAEQERAGYVADMIGEYERLRSRAGKDPKKIEVLNAEFPRYQKGYLKRKLAALSARSRMASPMITGPSNFPTARNQKAGNAYDNRMRELIEYDEKALNAIEAKMFGTAIIKSGEADTLERLKEKLAKKKEMHELMKSANQVLRNKKMTDAEKVEKLIAAGWKEENAMKLLEPDYAGKSGVPSFMLSNNLAEIKRIEQRIREEEKRQVAAEQGNRITDYEGEVQIVENFDDNRIQIYFPDKPEADTRKILKSNAFKWSPKNGVWQRQLTNNARYVTYKFLVKELGLKEVGEQPASTEKAPAAAPPAKEPALSGLAGAVRVDQKPPKPANIFTLPTPVGKWLGELQRENLVISLDGETHAGKSELAKQIVNALAAKGFTVAWYDLEQGGLTSKDTAASFDRNVDKANAKNIHVFAEAVNGVQSIAELAADPAAGVDVIAIDSATKLNPNDNSWFNELRMKYPRIIWLPIWQQNAKGGTRGGAGMVFDAPVHVKVYRPDWTDYKKNYAVFQKNRGNDTSKRYLVAEKKIVDLNTQNNE